MLQFSLNSPARSATTVKIKAALELYVPGRDPAATIKVPKALAKLDAPLASPALKAAKIDLMLLSPAAYAEQQKKQKLTDKQIEEIRAEAKKKGAPEKEVETAIGLAKALEGFDETAPPGSIILSGKKSAFDRIYRIDVLGADGKPMDSTSRSLTTRGDSASVMVMSTSPAPPPNATLQVQLLTDKTRMTVPVELSVTLP